MAGIQRANSKHLWWALVSLGFQPEAAAASAGLAKGTIRHLNLGMNMFDKPNKDAFYIVTHFLLEKLSPGRVREVFRHCWPVFDRKADVEFRKVTFAWIRDIAAEYGNDFPKVVASLFLSPGGPKFIALMLHLAMHVMLQEMRMFSTGDAWVPEAAAVKTQSVEMAVRRFELVRGRFLRAAVEQDLLMQEYQRRAQVLVKSIRDLRAEELKYDNLKRHEQEGHDENHVLRDKIVKVQSLWTDVNKMLSSVEKERIVLDSVVRGNVDQYVLDGTDRTLKIPRALHQRIEDSCQSRMGNVYEAGQLNVLRLLELLREALLLLEEERTKARCPATTFDLQHIKEQALLLGRALDRLKLTGKRITKEEMPEVKGFIQSMEEVWNRKWADEGSSGTPLASFLSEDPALEFIAPMPPLSFEPGTEANFRSCIFSRFPARLPDDVPVEQPWSGDPQPSVLNVSRSGAVSESSSLSEEVPRSETPTSCSGSPRPCTPSGAASTPSAPEDLQQVLRSAPADQVSIPKRANLRGTQPRATGTRTRAGIVDQEYNSLAEQFAEAVAGGSADGSRGAMDLEDLLDALSDPFSTRKQLPRTPESLISEVKNSWRRALEEGEAEKARLSARIAECIVPDGPAGSGAREDGCCSPAALQSDPGPEGSPDGFVLQAWESMHSTLPWESGQLQADCTQNSSDVVQFGIASETLPDLLGSESLLSSSDGALDEEQESPLLRLLPRNADLEWEQQSTSPRLSGFPEAYGDRLILGSGYTPQPLDPLPQMDASPVDTGWEEEGKVFSLDLDALELSPSSAKGRISLPKLITFSPVDDLES